MFPDRGFIQRSFLGWLKPLQIFMVAFSLLENFRLLCVRFGFKELSGIHERGMTTAGVRLKKVFNGFILSVPG